MAKFKCNSCGATSDTDATAAALGYSSATMVSFTAPSKCGNCGSSNISEVGKVVKQSKKKEGCFIATAIYGSYDEPNVLILRNWRDTFLKQSNLGRFIIQVYYVVGPFFAKLIRIKVLPISPIHKILDLFVKVLSKSQKIISK